MDNGTAIIIAACVPSFVAVTSGYFTRRAAQRDAAALAAKMQQTHDLVDGGLHKLIDAKDELRKSDTEAALAKGKLEGAAEATSEAVARQAAIIVATDAAKKAG
jgi:hypothetical protein